MQYRVRIRDMKSIQRQTDRKKNSNSKRFPTTGVCDLKSPVSSMQYWNYGAYLLISYFKTKIGDNVKN